MRFSSVSYLLIWKSLKIFDLDQNSIVALSRFFA